MLSDLDIVKVYYTMFGRAPDLGGFNYWKQEAARQGWDAAELVNRFLQLPVVHQAGYAPGQAADDYVANLYATLFGKQPDDGGYWAGQLSQGLSRGELLAQMVQAALGTPEGTPGKNTVLNKLSFSQYLVDLQAANGLDLEADDLSAWTDMVSDADSSVVQAVLNLKANLENALGQSLKLQVQSSVTNSGHDPLFDQLRERIETFVQHLDDTQPDATDDDVSFDGLVAALQQQGTLAFSDSIWASMRDGGADLDRDGKVEFGGESLLDNSLTLTGLNYLLEIATRMTADDVAYLQELSQQVYASLNNPQAALTSYEDVTNFYNQVSVRATQTSPVTQDMRNEMAEGYVELVGIIKNLSNQYGIEVPVLL